MRLKRFLPFAVIGVSLLISSQIGGLKFRPIYEPLSIKAQKNSPAYMAFEELLESERTRDEWAHFDQVATASLVAGRELTKAPLYTQKIHLPEMVVTQTPELIVSAEAVQRDLASEGGPQAEPVNDAVEDLSWTKNLPAQQARRIEEAHRRDNILDQKWDDVPSWTDLARQVLAQTQTPTHNQSTVSAAANKVYVAAIDPGGQIRDTIPEARVYIPSGASSDVMTPGADVMGLVEDASTTAPQTITGQIEIGGGLAVTNEHHIEIRRNDEGILKENGKVNLHTGLYHITVPEKMGTVVARLVNKDGKVLGEGSFRLSRLAESRSQSVQGPPIQIRPITEFAAVVASAYHLGDVDSAPEQTKATLVKGETEVAPKKDGVVAMGNVVRGSSTVLRAAAPGHLQTTAIIISGKQNQTPLYSENMIAALEDIVSQQRMLSFEGAPTIVWGKVSLDGKAVAGIEVIIESDPGLEPIYFNQFMLPDPSLKATSENGLYAFVGVKPGFHSILAMRSESVFGYQNAVVEEGTVAQGDIEHTINAETIPLRVYDAFSGEATSATVTMQSLTEELSVPAGVTTVTLPQLTRMGLLKARPDGADYVSARYLYNDNDNYIHIPLVKWSWLGAIKSYLAIDDMPSAGVIVGFVPDEDFEVYLAGYEKFEPRQIVYFDMQGRILQQRKGLAGGGFILYNVPDDTHEVVVIGNRTRKLYSRVLPVDPNSLSVLTFRE